VKRSYIWVVVALLWVVALLNYVDRQVIFSVLPLVARDLHVPESQLGLLSGAFLWIYGIASPLAGFLADRFGRRPVILASLLIWSAVTYATGLARSFPEVLAARALMGVSEACYLPAALASIATFHPAGTRSLATGLHLSGVYVGTVLGGAGGRPRRISQIRDRPRWGLPRGRQRNLACGLLLARLRCGAPVAEES
jgi:MFS family permease